MHLLEGFFRAFGKELILDSLLGKLLICEDR